MNCEQEPGRPVYWSLKEGRHFGWFLPVRIEKELNSRNSVGQSQQELTELD